MVAAVVAIFWARIEMVKNFGQPKTRVKRINLRLFVCMGWLIVANEQKKEMFASLFYDHH